MGHWRDERGFWEIISYKGELRGALREVRQETGVNHQKGDAEETRRKKQARTEEEVNNHIVDMSRLNG